MHRYLNHLIKRRTLLTLLLAKVRKILHGFFKIITSFIVYVGLGLGPGIDRKQ